jgi:ABC-type Co2+ transport system permease subunit
MKIFGRDPAFWVGVIEAFIALLVTFKFSGLTNEQAGLWIALVIAIGAVLSAWTTRDTVLAALVSAVKAALVVGVAYGLHITQEQIGLIAGLITVVGSGWLRTQTSPVETPVSAA